MTRIAIPVIFFLLISTFTACGSENRGAAGFTTEGNKKESASQNPDIDIARIMEAALNGNLATIEKALEDGYNVNRTDPDMHTALMMAAFNGHSTIISLLLIHGATPDLRDLNDRTALMYASSGAFNETVTLLLKAGANPNLVDNVEHFTALMFAAAEGQLEVVRTLLSQGADNSLIDVDSESAYDFAKANGHPEVAALLKQGTAIPLNLP